MLEKAGPGPVDVAAFSSAGGVGITGGALPPMTASNVARSQSGVPAALPLPEFFVIRRFALGPGSASAGAGVNAGTSCGAVCDIG